MKYLLLPILLLISSITFAQTTYYISSTGNDSNNGTSPSTPWKTIKTMEGGSTYLLKKGDTFYFDFSIYKTWQQNPDRKLILSSYGSGPKPVMSLYKQIEGTSWQKHSANVWKVDIKNPNNYSGFVTTDTNIGFLKVNGVIYGNKLSSLSKLDSKWDFYTDKTYLYVYSPVNPSTGNPIIEASSHANAIELGNNMEISDIAIEGSGAHAINGNNVKNITLRNIDITEIGGSYLGGYGNGTTRFGNGIQFWSGGKNCLIEGCTISKAYDVAFTMQGNDPGTSFVNITFQNNTLDSNEQSFEMWVSGNAPGFTNCKFINNNCTNAGLGWSHDLRPDKNVGVHILTYAWEVKNSDVLIEGNTFTKAKSGLYYWGLVWDPMPKFTSKNNTVFLEPNTLIRSTINTFTVKNSKSFVLDTGKEVGTIFNSTNSETPAEKKDQTIKFSSVPAKTFGDNSFELEANASSNLPVKFSLVSGPVVLKDNEVTITGAGTVTIKASQAGNSSFEPAADVTQTFTIAKKEQAITFNNLDDREYSTTPITLVGSATSGLKVSYSVVSGPATISSNVLTLTGKGKVTIKASQEGNENYEAAMAVEQSFKSKQNEIKNEKSSQKITFSNINDREYSTTPITLTASATSGLQVSYSLVSGPAAISGNVLTLTGTGNVTIKASQEGNEDFEAAEPVEQTFKINKKENKNGKESQEITFNAIGNKEYSTNPITLIATASSGLKVGFTVLGGPAKLSGNILTLTGVGTVKIKATQWGNGDYASAEQVFQTFEVTDPAQSQKLNKKSAVATLNQEIAEDLSTETTLLAYPNPFSSKATIEFSIAADERAHLEIFDMNGSLVKTLYSDTAINNQKLSFEFEGGNHPNGIYICRLTKGDKVYHKRLLLAR